MSNLIIKRIPELQELLSLQGNEFIIAYDPSTDSTRKIRAALLQGGTDNVTTWVSNVTYSQGQIVEWALKLWKSKVNNNIGNAPAENSFWEEVSRSEANGFGVWSAGVYTINPSMVIRNNRLYLLIAPQPFESTNFEAELNAGSWFQLTYQSHNEMTGRTMSDAHPISSITNLAAILANLQSSIPQTQIRYLLNSTVTVFGQTYRESLPEPVLGALVEVSGAVTGTNIATSNIIGQWVGVPVPAGQTFTIEKINVDLFARKNATARVVSLFIEFCNIDPDGIITVLGESTVNVISETLTDYNFFLPLDEYVATEGNRALIRVRAFQTGGGAAANAFIGIQDQTYSRWSFITKASGGGTGGGHIIFDKDGNPMPQRDGLQFSDGLEVEDSVEKTIIKSLYAKRRSYSIDFQTTAMIAQEINMFGAATINNVLANNVASIHLTWSGGIQQAITAGVNNIAVQPGDVLTWEITRTEPGIATLGVHLQIN